MAIPQDRLRVREARRPVTGAAVDTWRISWGGIWAGSLVGLGALLLLTILGLAVGISAADIGQGDAFDARAMGIGTAIWAGLSLLVALFVGGMVASRVSYVTDRTTSSVQGALVWVLVTFAIIYLVAATCSFLVAVTNNYTWNRLWTFRGQRGHVAYQGLRFLVVSTIALCANLILLYLLVAVGVEKVLAQAIAIVLVTPWNFVGNKLWSFGLRSRH